MLTRNETEARKIVQAKNDAVNLPLMNLVMAKTYLAAQDLKLVSRTWADVMEMFRKRGKPAAQMRHARVVRNRPKQYLRDKRLVEATADDFFHALSLGTNSTVLFLQTLHNDALGMGWIPAPILPRKRWPKMQKKIRRAITEAEHKMMVAAVGDAEWRLYLQLLWSIGASQTDGANLTSKNLDWTNRVLSYGRAKLDGRGLPLRLSRKHPSSIAQSWEAVLLDPVARFLVVSASGPMPECPPDFIVRPVDRLHGRAVLMVIGPAMMDRVQRANQFD